LLKCDA
jgi:hypothetical protein